MSFSKLINKQKKHIGHNVLKVTLGVPYSLDSFQILSHIPIIY
jgi:hypothetical protein